MITCDTSVLIAAYGRWNAAHLTASSALEKVDALVDHAVIETYSVLTRLPPPRRAPAQLVSKFLADRFPPSVPRLPSAPSTDVLEVAVRDHLAGGAIYDLVVALSAHQGGATLLSLDRRAAATYKAADVAYELLT